MAAPETGVAGEGESSLADYFRDPEYVTDSVLAWQLEQHSAGLEALRALFQGPSGLVRLRVWMLLTLTSQGQAFWSREGLEQLFHAVRPEATDSVIKRLREAALLTWDDTQRHYGITPLAQHCATMLAPLVQAGHDELAGLLGQVVGADQLGTLDAGQVRMLQAQLGRLHHEFADAIASGSEFRLREARKRYDRATLLIDKASDTIRTIISNAKGQLALEQAARALGQAQSKLLAMASQFNRALQQVDRQRVTLGTTGITSTDVKRWLQSLDARHTLPQLASDTVTLPVGLGALAPHELLDVTEAEFERDRPLHSETEALPSAQAAPAGDLSAVALPTELFDLSTMLREWDLALDTAPDAAAVARHVHAALLGACSGAAAAPATARYAQVAYKTQLLPLLGDAQARELPGATGELARQPWRVQWTPEIQAVEHPAVTHLSCGQLVHHPAGSTAAPTDSTP
nr:hypothetical protein [uncultured Rhodoferax sp.]